MMDDELEGLALAVRADTAGFASDIAALRGVLRDGLEPEAQAAGRGIEAALRRAARSGRLEFEDLGRVAARALGELAAAALRLDGAGAGLAGAGLLGLPGRATGGPVAPGRAYVVGERGPELFVPTSSGRVEAGGGTARGPVRLTVNVTAPREQASGFMQRSGRQIAREVRRALERADG